MCKGNNVSFLCIIFYSEYTVGLFELNIIDSVFKSHKT